MRTCMHTHNSYYNNTNIRVRMQAMCESKFCTTALTESRYPSLATETSVSAAKLGVKGAHLPYTLATPLQVLCLHPSSNLDDACNIFF